MEKRLKRLEIALIILLGISTINLLSAYFLNSDEDAIEETSEVKNLPEDVTREYLDKTVYKIKIAFNRSNWEALYKSEV